MKKIIEYANNLKDALSSLDDKKINELFEEVLKRIDGNGEIYIFGNGGSSANASHIVGDYSKTFATLNKGIKINCPSDNIAYLAAISNDLDYSEIFNTLINSRIKKGDLIIFLSGSGNSMNLIKAARAAKKENIKTVCLVGYSGGALKDLTDITIHIKVNDMEIAEDAQMAIFHLIKQNLIEIICEKKVNSSKYFKRINENLIA
ncbi:SIS domain-containing protein [Prochlorococcus sp. AH-716-J09]|nr:SIS domain-containing protein [Prochlorococcus sp. AH-716-J09]